jgi:alpha-tubulin suppressor-like RCC1 family protein
VTEDSKLWVMGDGHDFVVFPAAVESNLGNHRRYVLKTEVMSDVSRIAAGRAHVLILKNDGELLGFGDNTFGQLGSEYLARLEVIAQGVVDMFAGEDRSYYLTQDGQLLACGANGWGELGFGEWGIISFKGSNHRPIAHSTPQKMADDVRSVFAARNVP